MIASSLLNRSRFYQEQLEERDIKKLYISDNKTTP